MSIFFLSLPTGCLLSLLTIVGKDFPAPVGSRALHVIPSTEIITTGYVTDVFFSFVLWTTL